MSGMSCREFERPLMDRARNRPMDAAVRTALTVHLEICPRCSKALERQIRLSAAVEILAERASEVSAPPSVEQAILTELNAVHGVARRRRWIYVAAGMALAASLAIVWWMGSAPAPNRTEAHVPPPPPPRTDVVQASAAPPVETVPAAAPLKRAPRRQTRPAPRREAPFIAIPYTPPLDPRERVDMVRMDMPVAALIAAGLPVGTADPAGQVRTDVLVGQDGRARAVRLVSVASSN
ncbi:MAG TPA: hypothetical protein VHC72_14400 [Bryobacteraceae bacterium]|nr:hypothetical protein [Bryobacteraceae bacterium]